MKKKDNYIDLAMIRAERLEIENRNKRVYERSSQIEKLADQVLNRLVKNQQSQYSKKNQSIFAINA